MIYSFYFEGGTMDGEVVLTDFAAPNGSPPRSAAWIDFTLGGAVGLSFPVGDAKNVGLSASADCSQAGESDSGQQVYQVVYRDQNAGTVIVRCRYVPVLELIPPGVKRIIFAFVGGFRDGSTDEFTIAPSDNENRRELSPVVAGPALRRSRNKMGLSPSPRTVLG